MKASLLRRMILAQFLVVLGLWIINSGILLTWIYGRMLPKSEDFSLMRQAETLVAVLQDETDASRFRILAHRIQEVMESNSPYKADRKNYRSIFQILDDQGVLLFRSDAAPNQVLTLARSGVHDLVVEGKGWHVVAMEGANGRLRVLVAEAEAFRRNMIWGDIFTRTPVGFFCLFLVLALCTWPASRAALKPLRRLTKAVEARNPGDLSPLEGHGDLVETKPLVAALNHLFQRVQDLLETERRFVADAAHELRTPLAVIAAQAHVLSHAQDPVQRDRAERELQQGVDRGAQVIGQLLSVAHMEATGQALTMIPLDLAALARERVASLVPKALAKGQDLGYEGPETLEWEGDATVLGSAVDNLLVNAVQYTPQGGIITLRLIPRSVETILEVEDTGPGIPAEFQNTICDRFTRLPGTQAPGSGLGLAIVRRAAELHGGGVKLGDRLVGTGLLVTIRLPRRNLKAEVE